LNEIFKKMVFMARTIVSKTVSFAWKLFIFLIAFAIVLYVSIRMRLWSGDFTFYFIRTENWGMLLLITLIGAAVSMVLIKLLMWEFRIETRPAQKKKFGRRR